MTNRRPKRRAPRGWRAWEATPDLSAICVHRNYPSPTSVPAGDVKGAKRAERRVAKLQALYEGGTR